MIGFLLFGGKLSDLMGAAGKSLRQEGPALGARMLPPFWQRILQMLFKR